MATKPGKGKGQPKRVTAIRSAGNQTTGNCNKQLLPAERRRTDEADGRLNKQNPVSPQKINSINKSDEPSKNAGLYKSELIMIDEAIDKLNTFRTELCNGRVSISPLHLYYIAQSLDTILEEIDKLP